LTSLTPGVVGQEGCSDAKKFPPEFKRDVVRVARRGDLIRAEVAADFGPYATNLGRRGRMLVTV
jgi:transposase-like protein